MTFLMWMIPAQAWAAEVKSSAPLNSGTKLFAEPYQVQPGDTAESIAQKFGISVQQLMGLNGFRQPAEVTSGTVIKVPVPKSATSAIPSVHLPGIGPDPVVKLPGVPGGPLLPGTPPVRGQQPGGASVAVPARQPQKPVPAPVAQQQTSDLSRGVPTLQGAPRDNAGGKGESASSLVVSGKGKSSGTTPKDKGLPQDENIMMFKEIVDDAAWQKVVPGKRQFVQLSRYFVNQISCPEGKFVQALMPQDKFIETELSETGSELFLRVGNNPDKQFPLDLALICEDQTFMLNAVVHTGVPSQQIALILPKKVKEKANLVSFAGNIAKAEALPMEDQLLRIAKRVYQEKYLSYWEEDASIISRHKWYKRPFSIVANNVVRTHINGFVAWDFLVKGFRDGSDEELFPELAKAVKGKPVAIGKVAGPTVARVIVITQEADDRATAQVKGMEP
jgi:murein DD-endopeptidase MepM/ murein hydrolase activator NlpD